MQELINHYLIYLELLPLLFIGIICGVYNCLHYNEYSEENQQVLTPFLLFIKYATSSCVVSSALFFILDLANISYEARVGIAALVSFLGIDKAIEMIEKILNLKNHVK